MTQENHDKKGTASTGSTPSPSPETQGGGAGPQSALLKSASAMSYADGQQLLAPGGAMADPVNAKTPPAASGPLTDEAIKKAIKENKTIGLKPANLNKAFMHRVQDFFRLPITGVVDRALVEAIAAYQEKNQLDKNGVLNAATIKTMEGAGLNSKDPGYWASRDAESRKQIQADEASAQQSVAEARKKGDDAGIRQGIVALAASQIGQVNSLDRGDGAKYGWERIRRFYEIALPGNAYATDAGTKGANRFGGQTSSSDKKTGPWSWCGIFAVWAVKSATGNGGWGDGRVTGLTEMPAADILKDGKPGDIVRFSGSLNHHVILKRVLPETKQIEIIEGNTDYQAIRTNTKAASTVAGWYKAL